jgi:hypothetical protein
VREGRENVAGKLNVFMGGIDVCQSIKKIHLKKNMSYTDK